MHILLQNCFHLFQMTFMNHQLCVRSWDVREIFMRNLFSKNHINVCGHIYSDLDQAIYSTVISILNLRKLSYRVMK